MTPRQMCLLLERQRLEILHREMGPAQTTAAVINHSQRRPEEPVQPKDFMPSYRTSASSNRSVDSMTEEQLEAVSSINILIAEEAARQKALQYVQ